MQVNAERSLEFLLEIAARHEVELDVMEEMLRGSIEELAASQADLDRRWELFLSRHPGTRMI